MSGTEFLDPHKALVRAYSPSRCSASKKRLSWCSAGAFWSRPVWRPATCTTPCSSPRLDPRHWNQHALSHAQPRVALPSTLDALLAGQTGARPRPPRTRTLQEVCRLLGVDLGSAPTSGPSLRAINKQTFAKSAVATGTISDHSCFVAGVKCLTDVMTQFTHLVTDHSTADNLVSMDTRLACASLSPLGTSAAVTSSKKSEAHTAPSCCLECWLQVRRPTARFDQHGHALVFLPDCDADGLSEVHWAAIRIENPVFAICNMR